MIASFKHNFIFLKTRKVGGTSLEIVLSSWCGDEDICSPLLPEDEEIRAAYGGKARNFLAPDGSERFYNHMFARDVRRELPELWDKAFKFTVERHPYEKVVSRAWWEIGKRGASSAALSAEIDRAIESRMYTDVAIYWSRSGILVNEIWRYDEMWDRLRALARRLGLPGPVEPPRAKGQHRQDRRPAREVLSKSQRDKIYSGARIEFDLLGFER